MQPEGFRATDATLLDERHLLMTTVAPHLARPRRNLLPLTPDLPGPAGYLSALGPVAADLLRRRAGTAI